MYDQFGNPLDLSAVVGDIMGDMMGAAARGHARRPAGPRGRAGASRTMQLPPKPEWRNTQLAPGVQMPQEGLVPLPMAAQANGGVYNAANQTIQWIGKAQKPFRAQRLLFSLTLAGGAVGTVFCDGQFVGTDLQQGSLSSFDLAFFTATAFDVGQQWLPAQPGVEITLNTHFVGTIGGGTGTASLMILGSYIQ